MENHWPSTVEREEREGLDRNKLVKFSQNFQQKLVSCHAKIPMKANVFCSKFCAQTTSIISKNNKKMHKKTLIFPVFHKALCVHTHTHTHNSFRSWIMPSNSIELLFLLFFLLLWWNVLVHVFIFLLVRVVIVVIVDDDNVNNVVLGVVVVVSSPWHFIHDHCLLLLLLLLTIIFVMICSSQLMTTVVG